MQPSYLSAHVVSCLTLVVRILLLPAVGTERGTGTFTASVVAVIKRIPRGKVATYGQIAALAGSPRGARQVVWVLNSQSKSARLPWHRVINSRGRVALPRGRGFELQRALLLKERVIVTALGVIDMTRYLWHPRVVQRRK